jgi:hypothetical protein
MDLHVERRDNLASLRLELLEVDGQPEPMPAKQQFAVVQLVRLASLVELPPYGVERQLIEVFLHVSILGERTGRQPGVSRYGSWPIWICIFLRSFS